MLPIAVENNCRGGSMFGRVTKYDRNKGYGYILGEDGNTYFIHHSKLYGEKIARGYYVFFKPFQNERSVLLDSMN